MARTRTRRCSASAGRTRRSGTTSGALTPWMELRGRNVLDAAVQESYLAVPYAFGKLNANAQSAEYYESARRVLRRRERPPGCGDRPHRAGRHARAACSPRPDGSSERAPLHGWFWQLKSLPDAPESRYLYAVLAGHDFQEGLKNYRDLVYLSGTLERWGDSMDGVRGHDRHARARLRRAAAARAMRCSPRARWTSCSSATSRSQNELRTIVPQHDVAALGTDDRARAVGARAARGGGARRGAPRHAENAELRERLALVKGVLQFRLDDAFGARLWQEQRGLQGSGPGAARGAEPLDPRASAPVRSVPANTGEFAARVAALQARASTPLQARLAATEQKQSAYLAQLAVHELDAAEGPARRLPGAGALRARHHVRPRGERGGCAHAPRRPAPGRRSRRAADPPAADAARRAGARRRRRRRRSRRDESYPCARRAACSRRWRGCCRARCCRCARRRRARQSAAHHRRSRRAQGRGAHGHAGERQQRAAPWRTIAHFLELQNTDPKLRAEAMRRLGDLNLDAGEMQRLEQEVTRSTCRAARRSGSTRTLLKAYPDYARNDQVLYQLARAYETTGQPEQALATLDRIVQRYPQSPQLDEVQFRRGELLFSAKRYPEAEHAYAAVIAARRRSAVLPAEPLQARLVAVQAIARRSRACRPSAACSTRSSAPDARASGAPREPQARRSRAGRRHAAGDEHHLLLQRRRGLARAVRAHSMATGRTPGCCTRASATCTSTSSASRTPPPSIAPSWRAIPTAITRRTWHGGDRGLRQGRLQPAGARRQARVRRALQLRLALLEDPQPRRQSARGAGAEDQSQGRRDLLPCHRAEVQARRGLPGGGALVSRLPEVLPGRCGFGGTNYLLAEALFESHQYQDAAAEYEHTAYDYPRNDKSATAAYAALVSYQKAEESSERVRTSRPGTSAPPTRASNSPRPSPSTPTAPACSRAPPRKSSPPVIGRAPSASRSRSSRASRRSTPPSSASPGPSSRSRTSTQGEYAQAEPAFSQARAARRRR